MPQEASQREAYGRTLVELGRSSPDIVVLDADLCKSTMTGMFAAEFPGRAFDVGIAEQNMVGVAAGMAASGKVPFASTFAVFLPGRCFDQVRMAVAQPRLNVKLVVTHGGISVGEDGPSHQAIEDLSLACSLPGFTVIAPADAVETVQAVKAAAAQTGPFYIRLGRPKLPVVCPEDYQFKVGKAALMRRGNDATIIASGIMVAGALEAADLLAKENIGCRVLNMATLKPIDESAVISAAEETGAIVTAEEHLEHGGLGSIVARVLVKNLPVPMELISMDDRYGQSGKPAELLQRYGLTAKDIAQAVRTVIKRKH
ncbi:MAG: transketolase family protein [Dehalococcoidales bacterium]|nr:transketolase family protein [Dehalococcoidales bacterium]